MANVAELDYDSAHEFVSNNKSKGFFWDGWTIVKWSPGNNGYSQVNGSFRNGRWGYENRFEISDNGTWRIPSKYVSTK